MKIHETAKITPMDTINTIRQVNKKNIQKIIPTKKQSRKQNQIQTDASNHFDFIIVKLFTQTVS
jgi:hypothetical protein